MVTHPILFFQLASFAALSLQRLLGICASENTEAIAAAPVTWRFVFTQVDVQVGYKG